MNSKDVEFNESQFVAAHGKKPRGNGNWAFCPRALYNSDSYLDHVLWINGSYGEAKRAAASHYASAGIDSVVVCS